MVFISNMSQSSLNLQPCIPICSKLGYCWSLLFVVGYGCRYGFRFTVSMNNTFLLHFFLHAFYQLLYLEQNASMLLISFFFFLFFFTLQKVENTETLFEVCLTKSRQCFRTKQLQYSDGREHWDQWGRPLVIKFAYFIEERAAAGAGVRWKTLQLLIHPSTCSHSTVCF